MQKKVSRLNIGDNVDIVGPFGSALIMPKNRCIMVAEKTNIAPFLSILRSNTSKNCSLIFYDNDEHISTYYKNEFEELSKKYRYKINLNKWQPQKTDFISIFGRIKNKQIYISGSQEFVDEIDKIFSVNNVLRKRLHYGEYYPQTEQDKRLKKEFDNYYKNNNENSSNTFSDIGEIFLQSAQQLSNHIILTDYNGRILFANKAVTDITGYTFDEIKGKTPRIWGGLMQGENYAKMWNYLKKGRSIKKIIINRRRDGQLRTVVATITPILEQGAFVATEENISTLREVDRAKT